MDIYLEDKLIHRESLKTFIHNSPLSVLAFLSKIKVEEDSLKTFKFNIKLTPNPDIEISYDEIVESIILINGLYCNLHPVKINKLNKYIIELDIVGLIHDIIGFLMICNLSEYYLDLLDVIKWESSLVKYLMGVRHERIDSFTINRSFVIKYLMEFNRIDTYKTAFELLDDLNFEVKREIINNVCNKVYGFSIDKLLNVTNDNIDNLSIDNIDTNLLGKIVKYVEDKYE